MNPNKGDIEFINLVNDSAKGIGRIMYDPLIKYKLYKNKDYHFLINAFKVSKFYTLPYYCFSI